MIQTEVGQTWKQCAHTSTTHTSTSTPTQHTANTTAYQLAVMNQVSQVLHVQAQPRGVEGLAHQTNMLVDVSAGDEGNKTHQQLSVMGQAVHPSPPLCHYMPHYHHLGDVVAPGEHWVGLEEALGVHWVAPGVHRVESEDAQVLGFGEMVHLQEIQHLQGGWYKNLHK